MMSTRYMCFSFNTHSPSGGMGDCKLITSDYTQAKIWLIAVNTNYGTAYIYDMQANETIYKEDLIK